VSNEVEIIKKQIEINYKVQYLIIKYQMIKLKLKNTLKIIIILLK
jgi:hypothetical protein